GYQQSSGTVTITGVGGDGLLDSATAVGTNAGTYTDTASISGLQNYNDASVVATLNIAKATATVVVSGFTGGVFDTFAKTQTVTITGVSADGVLYTNSLTGTNAGSYSKVWSYTNSNYIINPSSGTLSFEITTRDAVARYIGQTLAVASGSSSTSAQVSLAASLQDPSGVGLVGASVTFIDTLTNRILAANIPVSVVAGAPSTGTANTFVTLSTGTYGAQLYNVKVVVTGNYDNADQLSDSSAMISVTKPAGTETISATGIFEKSSGVAGVYGVQVTGDTSFAVDLKYNKSGKNLQGKVELLLPVGNGDVISIKSNALNSMVIDGMKVNGTIYTKASATRINADGSTTVLEGNISLRVDLSENSNGMAAITAMSSSSQLLYSNDWFYDSDIRGWRSRLQAVKSGLIQIT
ncbi:MAG: hypothetical protein ACKO9Q_25660, partial [Pirellula sp.]